jgi:thiol-disulfide isomerase/thioredoxin
MFKIKKISDYSLFPLYFLSFSGMYSILVGVIYLVAPNWYFLLSNMDFPFYPFIWQYYGAIYISLGFSFIISSFNPARFWPVLLLNLLFKLFICLCFFTLFLKGVIPNGFAYDVIFNHLVFVGPICLILLKIYNLALVVDNFNNPPFEETIELCKTNYNQSISELSKDRTVLVVFLRHFGCVFCREILHVLKQLKSEIESNKIILVIVHMINNDDARKQLEKYELENIDCISDPDRSMYKSFGLRRGRLYQVFGFRVWWNGFLKGVLKGRGFGTEMGDVLQMSGVFSLKDSKVLKSFIPEYISELPELSEFIKKTKSDGLKDPR